MPTPPSSSTAPGERERIPADLLVLIGAAVIVALGFGLIAPLLPQYAKSFDVSDAGAAAIVSVFALCRLVFAPLAGRFAEARGERIGYVTGVLIVAASTLACAWAPEYWILLLVRGLGGIGSTMFSVSAGSFIARRSPRSLRGRVSGLYGGAFLFGNVAGPLVGGLLSPLGFRMPFVIYGVALILAAAVVFVMLECGSGRFNRAAALPPMTLAEAWARPEFRAAVIGNIGNGWVTMGVRTSLIPLFASAALGLDPFHIGVVVTLYALGNAGALTFSGKWSDTVGRRRPILVGMTGAGVVAVVVGLSPTLWVLAALSLLQGFFTGLFAPSQQATVADTVGPTRSAGRAMATFQMAADLPAIVAPLAAGLLADHLGYGWAFGLSGLVMFAGVLAWGAVKPTLRAD
ncbi:MAG: MFS transporter [Galactobacter sp.]